jgi:hypothetical protein
MNDRPYKEYLLEGKFNTDGDYHLDLDDWQLKLDGFDKYFLPREEGEDTYHFTMQTDDIYKIRDFLTNLIVIYRVGSEHYWVVKNLYDMTEQVLDAVFDDNLDEAFAEIGGNYDGTYISLTKFR